MPAPVHDAADGHGPKAPAHDPAADAGQLVFRSVWSALEKDIGRTRLRFPREIIWLNGAPGAGKGTNTPFIMRERSISAPPIVVSELLDSPEFRRIKDGGNLIGDRDVVAALLRKLLDPAYVDGVVVDGFPRTKAQVECLKQLYQRMLELHTADPVFPKPVFRLAVLYVEERESIARQLGRGRQIIAHNQRVRDTGVGDLLEERATDASEDAARKRYRVFREQTIDALQGLQKVFHYHLINAQGDLASVERNIIHEFSYQSSIELESATLDAIHRIPLASDVVQGARQHLVARLDGYQRDQPAQFRSVIAAIERELVPVIQLHAITGLAYVLTESPIFEPDLARQMVVDVLAERGYFVMAQVELRDFPLRVDLTSGEILYGKKHWYRFQIRFQGSVIRRGQ